MYLKTWAYCVFKREITVYLPGHQVNDRMLRLRKQKHTNGIFLLQRGGGGGGGGLCKYNFTLIHICGKSLRQRYMYINTFRSSLFGSK